MPKIKIDIENGKKLKKVTGELLDIVQELLSLSDLDYDVVYNPDYEHIKDALITCEELGYDLQPVMKDIFEEEKV